jgi:hypothetical protein
MLTSRAFFIGLADPLATSEQALERASRPHKAAGSWPSGTRGRGPAGGGIQAHHLAALMIGLAGDQPSDSARVYHALADLVAEATPFKDRSIANDLAPEQGARLGVWLANTLDRCSLMSDQALLATEKTLEDAGWTLSLAVDPATAFVTWRGRKANSVRFLLAQSELLPPAMPRRVLRVTTIPFRAVAAAGRLQALNLRGQSTASSISQSGLALPDASPERETPPQPARAEAAQSFYQAKTAESRQSALNRSRFYPTSRALRKGDDSDSAVLANPGRLSHAHFG